MYDSNVFIIKLQETMLEFVPNVVEGLKPKRENQIRDLFSSLYRWNLEVRTLSQQIQIDHMLGCNDVIIKQLVNDWTLLQSVSAHLKDELKKANQFKDVPAVKDALSRFDDVLSSKKMESHLVADLKTVAEKFDLSIDIKELLCESNGRATVVNEYWKARKG